MKLLSKKIRGGVPHFAIVEMLFLSDDGGKKIKVTAIANEDYIEDESSGSSFVEKTNDWMEKLIPKLESSDESKFGSDINYMYRPDTELFKKHAKDNGIR
jgi:hypothetical protein